jgi:hypothetical protein
MDSLAQTDRMTARVLALLREARKRAGAALVAEEKERGFSSDPEYPKSQDAFRANPSLTVRGVVAAAGVGRGTAQKARKQLEATGEIQPRGKATP